MTLLLGVPTALGEVQVEFEVDVEPGEPAVTSGPPDNWYPGSAPSLDICEAHVVRGKRRREIDGNLLLERNPKLAERFESAAWEKYDGGRE